MFCIRDGYSFDVNEAGRPSRRETSLIRPPRLHLGREGTASRLELLFATIARTLDTNRPTGVDWIVD